MSCLTLSLTYASMIDKSDFLIAYVEHNSGGAYRTLEYTKRKKHMEITNIFQLQ
jgi:hypothetical protein